MTHPGSPVGGGSPPTDNSRHRKELPARTGDIFPVNKSISVDERVGGEVLGREI